MSGKQKPQPQLNRRTGSIEFPPVMAAESQAPSLLDERRQYERQQPHVMHGGTPMSVEQFESRTGLPAIEGGANFVPIEQKMYERAERYGFEVTTEQLYRAYGIVALQAEFEFET